MESRICFTFASRRSGTYEFRAQSVTYQRRITQQYSLLTSVRAQWTHLKLTCPYDRDVKVSSLPSGSTINS